VEAAEVGRDMGDVGTQGIQLRVLDDPSRRHSVLTPMWSDPYFVTVQIQRRLIVIGDHNKTIYKAGETIILCGDRRETLPGGDQDVAS